MSYRIKPLVWEPSSSYPHCFVCGTHLGVFMVGASASLTNRPDFFFWHTDMGNEYGFGSLAAAQQHAQQVYHEWVAEMLEPI